MMASRLNPPWARHPGPDRPLVRLGGVIGAANICSYGRNEQGAGSFLYEPSLTLTVNLFPATPEQFGPQRPQSSSASRFTAGAFGFLTLSQCGERPER